MVLFLHLIFFDYICLLLIDLIILNKLFTITAV